jgi:hypothetical protein
MGTALKFQAERTEENGSRKVLSSANGTAFTLIDTVDATATSHDDTSLDPSDSVQYEVVTTGNTNDNIVSSAATTQPVTTPDGSPTFNVTPRATGSNTAVLTWAYQGNNASAFEIEEEDTSIAGTNFYNIRTTSGTGTMTVGLTGGDSYQFRIRADHNDGSVSDYVSGGVSIPLSDTPGLSGQTFTIFDGRYGPVQEIEVGWSGASVSDGINLEVKSSAWAGNAWAGVWYVGTKEDARVL